MFYGLHFVLSFGFSWDLDEMFKFHEIHAHGILLGLVAGFLRDFECCFGYITFFLDFEGMVTGSLLFHVRDTLIGTANVCSCDINVYVFYIVLSYIVYMLFSHSISRSNLSAAFRWSRTLPFRATAKLSSSSNVQ